MKPPQREKNCVYSIVKDKLNKGNSKFLIVGFWVFNWVDLWSVNLKFDVLREVGYIFFFLFFGKSDNKHFYLVFLPVFGLFCGCANNGKVYHRKTEEKTFVKGRFWC